MIWIKILDISDKNIGILSDSLGTLKQFSFFFQILSDMFNIFLNYKYKYLIILYVYIINIFLYSGTFRFSVRFNYFRDRNI